MGLRAGRPLRALARLGRRPHDPLNDPPPLPAVAPVKQNWESGEVSVWGAAWAGFRSGPIPKTLTYVGDGIRRSADHAARSIENSTQTGNDNWAGQTLAAIGGAAGYALRVVGGIGGSVVDLPGTAEGVVNHAIDAVHVGGQYGALTGISHFVGTDGIAEWMYNVDLLTGRELQDGEGINRLAGGIGAASGVVLTIGGAY